MAHGHLGAQQNWRDASTPGSSPSVRSLRECPARAPLEINLSRITPLGVNAPGQSQARVLKQIFLDDLRLPSGVSVRRIISRGTRAEILEDSARPMSSIKYQIRFKNVLNEIHRPPCGITAVESQGSSTTVHLSIKYLSLLSCEPGRIPSHVSLVACCPVSLVGSLVM